MSTMDVELTVQSLGRDLERLADCFNEKDHDRAVKVTIRMMLTLSEMLHEQTGRWVKLDLDELAEAS